MAARKSELIITCNAKGVQNVMRFMEERLKGIKQILQVLNEQGNKTGWTDQMRKEFKELTDEAAGIDTIMKRNQETMRKYGQVMKDLAGSKLKDLKSALREATQALNKMSEKSPGREKLITDIARIKAQIAGTSGLSMSFTQAQKQLKDLDNTSMDKLKQGLAAIKAQLDNPNIGNKWRRSLEQMQQQYQAAMAVRTAPTGVMPVTKMNAQQLGAERTALMSAIAATSGVKGYESKTAGMEQRLKAVNEQLTILSEKEKKAATDAKKLQATQEAAQTVRAVYRGQAVELEKLQAAYRTLQARQQQFAGTNDAKARASAQQMALLKSRIDKVTAAMQAEIRIDKQFLRTATTGQLQNALTQLQQKLQSLTSQQGATARKLKADMKAVETQIRRNTGAIQQQGSTFGTAIKNITAYVGVFGAFNFLKNKITSVYQANLKLSDSLADIRKVSGLTSVEIDKLYSNITRIDTRNTIETLNKLAYAGAKLGVQEHGGVEALTGFVRAAEQVQMALGEDLGEEALPALAKLTEVMGLMDKYGVEQSMQKAASAIFQLSTTSTATGKNIVEFSKRLMGLANVSRVTADELLAIGSAADAMGLMPEVAATAFNKLFTSIQKGHNMIEKSLGLVQGSINENFAKGQTIKSIVDIFDAMNKKGNMNALDNIFKDLGSDGARLVAVMTTMADRVDILKKHLETSTKAFKDGTAVINEYMIQNETANALMERASNMWAKAFTNPEGVDMVKQLAEKWYDVSKALTQSENSMYALHYSLEAITDRLVEIVKILPFLIKMFTWFTIFGGIRMMVNSFIALVAAIRAATTATATLQAVMNSNWVLAGLSAVVGGISLYIDQMNAAAEAAERAQKRQAELDMQLAKSKEAINTVAAPLESYKRALNESNYSLEKRNQLMKDLLKGEYQDYLDFLGIEIESAIDLAKAYDMVVKVMKQKKAYEEREQYRDEINQNNKIDRMRAGMQFGQAARAIGSNVDAEWLRQRHNLPTEDIMTSVIRSAGGSVQSIDLGRGAKANTYYDKAGNLIEAKVIERLRKNIREYSTSRNTENRLNREVDELYKEEVGDFNMENFQDAVLKSQLKRKGQLENLKPDKAAAREARKAESEAKQRMRKEMEDMQKQSTGIISKIEEYYRLQETAITEARADNQITEERANEMVRTLNIFKNETLATARRAVTTGQTETWDNMKQMILPAVMSDTSDLSKNLLSSIMDVEVDVLHSNLAKFNGSKDVFGLSASAFFDQMNAKAAGNDREAARLKAKIQNEIDKSLLQYHFVDQALRQMDKDFETMGFVTETYEQWADRMQKGIIEKPDTNVGMKPGQRTDMINAYMTRYAGTTPVADTSDAEALQKWLDEFTEGGKAKWAVGLPSISDWLADANGHLPEIQEFYRRLMDIQQSAQQRQREAATTGKAPELTTAADNQYFDQTFGQRITDQQARTAMGRKFIDQGVISYNIDIENKDSITQWLLDFTKDAEGNTEQWVAVFPKLLEWLKRINAAMSDNTDKTDEQIEEEQRRIDEIMPEMQQYYRTLMQWEGRYYDAQRKAYDLMQKRFEEKWDASGYGRLFKEAEQDISLEGRRQKLTGEDRGVNFGEQAGFLNMENDPELQLSMLRMAQMQKELEEFQNMYAQKKLLGEDLIAFNEGLAERQRAVDESEMAMQEALMQHINEHISKLQEWTAPIEQFGADVGDAMGKAVFESESMVDGMRNALKTLAQSWGEHTITIVKELMMQQVKQRMINKAMKKEQTTSENALTETAEEGGKERFGFTNAIETGITSIMQQAGQQRVQTQQTQDAQETQQTANKTIFDVLAGIAGGSAKTIESLGWWGIPLVAVITALLMGLLNTALSALGGSSGKGSETAQPKTKVKLKSGMLTYDRGNIQEVAGRRRLPTGRTADLRLSDERQWRGEHGEYLTDTRRTSTDLRTQTTTDIRRTSTDERQMIIGDDGRVYQARSQASLPQGVQMITEPIATRVNGQQALVGERGPEIVIGRKTTRAIQMNRPDLLRDLMLIDRGITTRRVRTFDEGNLQDLASALRPDSDQPQPADRQQAADASQLTAEDARALTAAIGVFAQTVAAMQRDGIPAKIQKYGKGGLIDEVKTGMQFVGKYGG